LARFGTRIFSSKTGDAFLQFLADLEQQAGEEHVQRVAAIYGEDWSIPYREMLIHEREREARYTDETE
jgi:predicted ArsR family transcriptional regulator